MAHEREEKREGGTDRRNQMIRKLIKAGLTELQVRSNSAQMKMGKSRSVGAGHRSRAVLCHPRANDNWYSRSQLLYARTSVRSERKLVHVSRWESV